MRPTVIIVADPEDLHALSVQRELLAIGQIPLIWDSSDLPARCKLSYSIGNGRTNGTLCHASAGSVDFSELRGVWWRRPELAELDASIPHPKLRWFAQKESEQALTGFLLATARNFVNPLGNSRQAIQKVFQLKCATEIGLTIPMTFVSNDPQVAIDFARPRLGHLVYKTFTGADFGMFETRLLSGEEDLRELWRIATCPVLLQEHIDGDYDLRITIVGEQIFPAKLEYKKGRHPVDSRVDRVPMSREVIPESLGVSLLALMRRLGLVYGAIDMRYSERDGYTFFEINPEGQFLWVEIETGHAISAALARHLAR